MTEDDWSVDDLRSSHECDEHWLLRREFLIRNKNKFSKMRMLSLSQVFSNMEFLGCKYPEETMALVAELSVGIVEEYRKRQSARLQRTFMKASAAAEAKSKGGRKPASCPVISGVVSSMLSERSRNYSKSNVVSGFYSSQHKKALKNSSTTELYASLRYSFSTVDLDGLVLVEQLFLVNDTPSQMIHRSCQMSGKQYTYSYETTSSPHYLCTCTFKLGNFTASGSGTSKELAKQDASASVIYKLRKVCHTLQIKTHLESQNEVSLVEIQGAAKNNLALDSNNIGNKLLRLMGWSGGGLGKNEDGMQGVIDVSNSVGRSRLGFGKTGNLTFTAEQAEDFLKKEFQNQSPSKRNRDVVFSSEFSKSERELIHRVARRLHLKSKSYGKEKHRSLVVSQKITLPILLREIIECGESEKYRVVLPENLHESNQK